MERIGFDDYFMEIAKLVSKRSTCLRRKVGAILVRDKRIIATGYNGSPSSVEHCEKRGCLRSELGIESGKQLDLCYAVHAEQNAIIQAAKFGLATEGASIYITVTPCFTCAKMIINAGIKEIVIDGEYPDERAMDILREAQIAIRKI